MTLRLKTFMLCVGLLFVASTAPAVTQHHHGGGEAAEGAADFVRNVEEVRGHLNASLTLARNGDSEGASLHANHPPDDYLGVILPPVEEEDPDLAGEIETTLNEAPEMAEGDTEAYADYIRNDVDPLLDQAVETVVSDEKLDDPTFQAEVNMALLGRIDDEYSAAIAENGTTVLEGEYWDGRGFLSRIETRHAEMISAEFDEGVGSDLRTALDDLRTKYEDRVPPSELTSTTARLRVLYEAGLGNDDAVIDDEAEAVRFMRNAEEVKGHLESSITLKGQDADGASLHAGHPTDYIQALGPATYTADEATYETLSDVAYATGDRVSSDSASEYESYVRDEVFPALDSSVEAAVPSEYWTTETRAQVAVGLSDRLMEEYSAAVTEEDNVELEGEYWDGRGFLVRIETIHEEELSDEMSEDTNSQLTNALEDLRSSYEDRVPPSDLEPAVEDVKSALESADFEAAQQDGGSMEGDGDEGTDSEGTEDSDGTDGSGSDTSDTDGEDGSDDGSADDGGDGSQGMPGFTAVAALVALIAVAFVLRRE